MLICVQSHRRSFQISCTSYILYISAYFQKFIHTAESLFCDLFFFYYRVQRFRWSTFCLSYSVTFKTIFEIRFVLFARERFRIEYAVCFTRIAGQAEIPRIKAR